MKVFSASQLHEADKITLQKQETTSTDLMERAATLVFNRIHQTLKGSQMPVKVFCGIGNNGGDGLVIGRLLMDEGYNVTIYVVNYSDKRSRDFLINYDRVKNMTKEWPTLLKSEEDFPKIEEQDLVIDAIFGVGLNRPLVEWTANLIRTINASGAFVVSVDVPSGMFADKATNDKSSIVKANYTYAIQAPKQAFFLPETGGFVGMLEVVDIGLDKEYLSKVEAVAHVIGKAEARVLYIPREKFSHKGTYGHALLVGGSYGKMGSICLASTGALRAGAGMATIFAPKCGHDILQSSLPEAMLLTDENEKYLCEIKYEEVDPSVICFGVGVGKQEETLKAFEALLERTEEPMVIDADGLNLLSGKKELLLKVPRNSVLTPHPKELERLLGTWKDDFEKIEKAREFVRKHQLILVIKGAHTLIISEKDVCINTTGNPGMATAGSGDVLAGVITGLISQKYDPLSSALLGVYLHGKAGDIAARKMGPQALLARDILDNLGNAYLELFRPEDDSNTKD